MVKIPGLDDLKKMGSDLIDSAKALKLGDMVDKVKTSVESVTSKKPQTPVGDEAIRKLFEEINAALNELMESHSHQTKIVRNIQGLMSNLSKAVESIQQPNTETMTDKPDSTEEMKKP